MNSLKKNSVKQECSNNKKKLHIPGVKPWVIRLCAVVLTLAIVLCVVWYVVPRYYAKFYLTRSALQTKEGLFTLWNQDEGVGNAYEDHLKLVADEVRWNGHSVLLLPAGLGISFTEQRSEDDGFSQGSLNVYFLGAIREGISYWADNENVVFHIPGITQISAQTTQESLKNSLGFTLTPGKKSKVKNQLETIGKDSIHMMAKSQIRFVSRDKSGVVIEADVPAAVFDSFLNEVGDFVLDGPLKDMKEWGQMLKDDKTQGESKRITISIDKNMNLNKIDVEGLGTFTLTMENNQGISLSGNVSLNERSFAFDSKLYFGYGIEGKRSFQISSLNIDTDNGKSSLRLELSGGYQGGKISSEVMERDKFNAGIEQPEQNGIDSYKENFLKKIRLLGFDMNE
jgi:hypothetical protein